MPTPELARTLNRPKAGLYNKAFSLGLKHGYHQPFSDDEECCIRVARDHGISLTDLSAALDRDLAVVGKHAIRMGIPFSTRTRRAPRGSRLDRPPITLERLLAMGAAESEATRQGCADIPKEGVP